MSARVASLLPSATEIVALVGAQDDLVGVSHECDHPPQVRGRRVLTRTLLRPDRTSPQIDRDVRALLTDALGVYEVDLEALRAAAPDVIVTQDLCDVCAVPLGDVQAAAREVLGEGVEIVNLRPTHLGDIFEDVRRVGAALSREDAARAAVQRLEGRVEAVRARAAPLPSRPPTLTIEWLDPILVGGTWMPELVELAGGTPLVTRPGQHAPTISREELAALDPAPEVVLIKPCGFDLARTVREREAARAVVEALPRPPVAWVADGNAYFNRPGPRIVDSLEILAACVHPEAFADLARTHAGAFRPLAEL